MARSIVCPLKDSNASLKYGLLTAMLLPIDGRTFTALEVEEAAINRIWHALRALIRLENHQNLPLDKISVEYMNFMKTPHKYLDTKLHSVYKTVLKAIETHTLESYPKAKCKAPEFFSPAPKDLADGIVNYLFQESHNLTATLLGKDVKIPRVTYLATRDMVRDMYPKLVVSSEKPTEWVNFSMAVENQIVEAGGFVWRNATYLKDVINWLWEDQNYKDLHPLCLARGKHFVHRESLLNWHGVDPLKPSIHASGTISTLDDTTDEALNDTFYDSFYEDSSVLTNNYEIHESGSHVGTVRAYIGGLIFGCLVTYVGYKLITAYRRYMDTSPQTEDSVSFMRMENGEDTVEFCPAESGRARRFSRFLSDLKPELPVSVSGVSRWTSRMVNGVCKN